MGTALASAPPDAVLDTPLGRAARLLDAVSAGPLRFSEAQQLLDDLAPSSLNRLLKAMLALGMLERTAEGAYGAGPRLVRWQRSEDTTLRMLAGPVLDQLEATVIVLQRAGNDLVVVDRRTHDTSPALMKPGVVRPITAGMLGGPLFMDEGELHDERTLRKQLDQQRSGASMADLRRIFVRMRQNGWWDDKGRIHGQVRRIAVPIRRDGDIVAAVGLGCWANRGRDQQFRQKIVHHLQRAARRLERGLHQDG